MADFPLITRLMEKQGLDALLTLGMRNCAYLAGDVTEEPWLNEPQGLGAWMTCIAPPDKSFAIGGNRMADFDMPLDRFRPDQTRDARLQVVAEEIQARKLGQARVGLDMDYAAISDLAKLRELLPNVQFEAADMLLARARSMKTPRELDWIKKAVAASEAGYKEMQKEIRAGIPFRDLNNVWAATVLKHDALPVYAAPISWMVPGRGQYKQPDSVLVRGPEEVEEGLVYRVDYSAVAGGYFSDQKFNFCLGTPHQGELCRLARTPRSPDIHGKLHPTRYEQTRGLFRLPGRVQECRRVHVVDSRGRHGGARGTATRQLVAA